MGGEVSFRMLLDKGHQLRGGVGVRGLSVALSSRRTGHRPRPLNHRVYLLKMQTPGPHPSSTESECLPAEPGNLHLKHPPTPTPGDSVAH